MADIFISYGRQDEAKVRMLAGILEQEGLSSWFDQHLFAGDDYRRKIEVALRDAKVVLVCWSQNSVESDWVRSEAEDARISGKLVGVAFDDAEVPKPFNAYHVEQLTRWQGALRTPAIERLVEAIRARVEDRPPAPVPVRKQWLTGGAIGAFVVTLIAVIGWFSGILQPLFIRGEMETIRTEMAQVRREMSSLQFDLMAQLTARAAAQGIDIPDSARSSIAATIATVLDPAESRRADARAALESGDFEGAATALVKLAEEQSAVVVQAQTSAAKTYGEAGDLFFATDTDKAIDAYENATSLDPGDTVSRNQLGHLYRRIGDLDKAATQYQQIIDAARTGTEEDDRYWEGAALSNLGNLALTRNEIDEAEAYFTRALEIQTDLGNREEMAIAIGNLGVAAIDRGDLDAAEDYARRALAIQEELGLEGRAARQLRSLGHIAAGRDDLDAADEFYNRALAIYEKIGDEGGAADQLTGLASNAFSRSEYQIAREYASSALEKHRRLEYKEGVIADLGNLGAISLLQSDYSAAEKYFKESLSLGRELGSRRSEASALGNLGSVARVQGDLDGAENYYKQALVIGEEIGAMPSVGFVLNNLGTVAWLRADYDAAAGYYERSRIVHEELGQKRSIANNLGNLGNIAEVRDDLDSAHDLHQQALTIRRETGDKIGEAWDLSSLGRIARRRGDLDTAELRFNASYSLYEELDDRIGMAVPLNGLGTIARLRNNFSVARDFHERALSLAQESEQPELIAPSELGLAYVDRQDGRTGQACERLARAIGIFAEQQTERAKDARRLSADLGCPLAVRD